MLGKMYKKNFQAKLLIIQFLCIGNIAGVVYGLSHFLCLSLRSRCVYSHFTDGETSELGVSQCQSPIFNPSNNLLNLQQLEPEDRPVSFMNIKHVT